MNLPPSPATPIMHQPSTDSAKGAVNLRLLGCLFGFFAIPFVVFGAAPTWWSTSTPPVISGTNSNDYAAVNQGQVKNIATAAVAEFDLRLPGGAGIELHNLVNSWATPQPSTNDYAAVNLGQLKALAKPFYDRLIIVGYTDKYPWAGSPNPANDYAMANIGQVKNLFGFDLIDIDPLHDADQDGLPDWWEDENYANSGQDAPGDADGDGRSNLTEYLAGSDPNTANGEVGPEFTATGLRVFTPLE